MVVKFADSIRWDLFFYNRTLKYYFKNDKSHFSGSNFDAALCNKSGIPKLYIDP